MTRCVALALAVIVACTGPAKRIQENRAGSPAPSPKLSTVATIALKGEPARIAAADGEVWVSETGNRTVARIDARTRRVTKRVSLPMHPFGIAVTRDAVWVTISDVGRGGAQRGELVRIERSSGRVTGRVSVGSTPVAVAADGPDVWVADARRDAAVRVDASSLRIRATLKVAREPVSVAIGGGRVWVACSEGGAIMEIDPAAGKATSRLPVAGHPRALTFQEGSLWLAAYNGAISRIDPASGVARQIALISEAGLEGIGVDAGSIWVVSRIVGMLFRVDAVSGEMRETFDMAGTAHSTVVEGLAIVNGEVWVGNRSERKIRVVGSGPSPSPSTAPA